MQNTTPQETGFTSENKGHIMNAFDKKMINISNKESDKEKGFNYEYNKNAAIYKTGEAVPKGIYICNNCGTDLTMQENDKLPPCPRCGNLEFEIE